MAHAQATDTHSEYVILIAFLRQVMTRTRLNITLHVHSLSPYKCTGYRQGMRLLLKDAQQYDTAFMFHRCTLSPVYSTSTKRRNASVHQSSFGRFPL